MAGQTEYVNRAFEADFQTAVEAAMSVAVHYPGMPFVSTAQKEWLRIQFLDMGPEPANDTSRIETWIWQVDAYARVGSDHELEPTSRVWELADFVVETYRWREVEVVNVDAAAPQPVVGRLEFKQPEVDRTPIRSDDVEGDRLTVTLEADFENLS